MTLTKQDWMDSFNASEQLEGIYMQIGELEEEIEKSTIKDAEYNGHQTLESYHEYLQSWIGVFEDEAREIRKNVIPTDAVGDYYGEP